jgi:MFS family permease
MEDEVKTIAAQPDSVGGAQDGAPAFGLALAALSLAVLLASLGTSIANVGLPALAQAFGASFQSVQWVVLAYLLAVTALVVGAGRLGDVVGRRRLMLAGIALFAAASASSGAAPTLGWLVAARAAQGAGAAVMMALAMALVGGTVPKERTGRAMGLLGTMSALGTALGPSLGGALIAGFGWRAIFLAPVPLGILAFALAWRTLPADRPSTTKSSGSDAKGTLPADRPSTTERPGFDAAGTGLLALALAAYALAMTVGRGDFGWPNGALLAAAAVAGALFLRVERRAASPLIRPAMLRDPALREALVTSALVATVMMATLVVGPFYLARGLGLDAAAIGLAMSAGPVVAALAGVPAGRLVDRFGPERMTLAGLGAMAAGAGLLALMPARFGVAGYLAAIAILTAGYAAVQAANNTAAMRDVPADRRGVVSGLLNLARNLGLVTGASAMGAVFARASGAGDAARATPEAASAGMTVTFAAATLVILAAVAAAAAGRASAARRGAADPADAAP